MFISCAARLSISFLQARFPISSINVGVTLMDNIACLRSTICLLQWLSKCSARCPVSISPEAILNLGTVLSTTLSDLDLISTAETLERLLALLGVVGLESNFFFFRLISSEEIMGLFLDILGVPGEELLGEDLSFTFKLGED